MTKRKSMAVYIWEAQIAKMKREREASEAETRETPPPYPNCHHPDKCTNGRCLRDPVCMN